MKKIIFDTYAEMCKAAADYVAEQLANKPDSVLGLATGSTPLGLYDELVRRSRDGVIDFSQVRTFNLDEYYPIRKDDPQSYNYYMQANLFSKVDFLSTRVLDGEVDDPLEECAKFDTELNAAGGIDLQILGMGPNGHIAFNEPSESYLAATHLEELTDSTIDANSRFLTEGETLPTAALTMGIGSIFSAKKILLLINGKNKAGIAKLLFEDKIHTLVPASLLKLHHDVTVLMDREAADT